MRDANTVSNCTRGQGTSAGDLKPGVASRGTAKLKQARRWRPMAGMVQLQLAHRLLHQTACYAIQPYLWM
jgi:hypothetical protein